MNLREDIKKQLKLLNEQVYNLIPGTPTLGKRIYGCSCELAPGVPTVPYNWGGSSGWDPTLNNGQGGTADWATTYPLTDGMGRVYSTAEYQLLPQVVRNALWTYGALPIGPVNSPAGYLFCPPTPGTLQSYWYQGFNRIVNCQLPQAGDILQSSGSANMKIAHNGAFLDEFKPWLYGTKNQYTAPCPSGGDIPINIDCSHQYADCPNGIPACSELSPILGCTDSAALNYDPLATQDDGSCTYDVSGCMDNLATNYDPNATIDSGTCEYDFSDSNINQMTRICTCEDNPIDNTGQPNNSFACNGGQPLGIPLRFSDATPPAINLINHQAEVGNLINNVPPHANGTFPSTTLWVIVDVLAVGSGGAATVVFQNTNDCPTDLPTSGYVTGVGYVGTKPIDKEKEIKYGEKERKKDSEEEYHDWEKEERKEKIAEEIKRYKQLL